MFRCDIRNLICDLRDKLCPPNRPNDDGTFAGVVFTLNLDLCDYDENGRCSQVNRCVQLLFCGNTSVFHREVTDPRKLGPVSTWLSGWVNTNNHDSCWRTSGFSELDRLYFQMADEANPGKAPILLHDSSRLGDVFGRNLWDLVTVKLERDRSDPIGYQRKVTSIAERGM